MDAIRKEVTHLAAEATKKHEEGLVLRDEATKIHNKTLEMREKILVVKKERWAEQQAKRKEIDEYNKEVCPIDPPTGIPVTLPAKILDIPWPLKSLDILGYVPSGLGFI